MQIKNSSLSFNFVRDKLWNHAENNFNLYSDFILDNQDQESVLNNLFDYLYKKSYNQDIVDFIPYMLATVFDLKLVTIHSNQADPSIANPLSRNIDTSTSLSNNVNVYVFIMRTSVNHYDALKPRRGESIEQP